MGNIVDNIIEFGEDYTVVESDKSNSTWITFGNHSVRLGLSYDGTRTVQVFPLDHEDEEPLMEYVLEEWVEN